MVKTINDAHLDLRARLKESGVAGYSIEAKELICYALKITPQELYERRLEFVFDAQLERIEHYAMLRLLGTPIQHIIGQWDFYSLTLEVSQDTLIPRADTEALVERGIEYMLSRSRGRILDLCCGSGCVGIAALKNLPLTVTAVLGDVSQAALRVAKRNVALHGLSGRCLCAVLDAFKPAEEQLGRFNLILCNPPYIPSSEIDTLDIEVQKEPRMALDGGSDGLDFYRAIADNYKSALASGGMIMFEVGLSQYGDVCSILEKSGYSDIAVYKDLTGIERVVSASSYILENK